MIKLFFLFDKTALHLAILKENFEIIKILMSNKSIDTDIKDDILF